MPYKVNPLTGNLDYYQRAPKVTGPVPLVIATGASYTVASNTQARADFDLVVNGELILDGEVLFG